MKASIITGIVAVVLSVGAAFAVATHYAAPSSTSGGSNHLGALTGPDIPSPYIRWGGVEEWNATVPLSATSSVIAAIQNPAAATSTVAGLYCNVSVNGIATDVTFDISTSSTAFGSSTPAFVYAGTITASKQKSIAWLTGIGTTTNTNILGEDKFLKTGESPYILGPSEYMTFKLATGTPGTFASYMTGSCSMQTVVIGRV